VAIEARWPNRPVASTLQLVEAGIDDRLLTAAVRNGVLLRLRRGAYVRSSYWSQIKPWERDDLRIRAHYEATGGTARYSHVSAARLHACSVWNCGPLVHVTTCYSNSRSSTGPDVKTHLFALDESEVVTLQVADGREIYVTSLERTVLDCARLLRLNEAAVIGDHALRKGADLPRMWRMLEQSAIKRGSRRAVTLLEALDVRSESAGETRTRLLLRAVGVEGFQPQYELPTREGLFRADFADPARRVIIEFDGKGKYSDFAPTEEVLLAERARENALTEEGWIFLRLAWQHLASPVVFKRRVLAATARAQTQNRPRSA
jgi:predicted transcriptional regulator of viral defense system